MRLASNQFVFRVVFRFVFMVVIFFWLLPSITLAKPPLNIHVSILPQKYFVERIGKDRVRVDVLVKPGKNPATYSPSPDQIKTLTASDIYFRIGVSFETSLLHRIESILKGRMIDTRQGIKLREMEEDYPNKNSVTAKGDSDNDEIDSHKDHNHQDHTGKDPHIWMSPVLVKKQAHTIYTALSRLDPDSSKEYKTNYDLFIQDLNDLDQRLKASFINLKNKNLFVFHPSFGYFTDAYGLRQIAVETMGKSPKGKTLSNFIKLAKKKNVKFIFAQPQFDRNAARKIASAINGSVLVIDPLAYNYLANMENIAKTLSKTLNE